MIRFDKPLVQFIFLPDESLNHLPHFPPAFLLVPLHLPESALVLAQHLPDLILTRSHPLHVRHYRVLYHLSVLTEPQRAKCLFQL